MGVNVPNIGPGTAPGLLRRWAQTVEGRWAAANMTPPERAAATVYTSDERCPMCAAAHGWVGLGRIVYVTSTEQAGAWLAELGVGPAPVLPLAIRDVVPGVEVAGPVPGLAEQVRDLHRRFRSR
jgi:tRNA(Arg) A34 adenosine deaminase TadA